MYLPKHFSLSDNKQVIDLIEKNPFATVMSYPANEKPFVNHLPVVLADPSTLIGHMAKANPQWKHFKDNPDATILIHGPHTYITPKWYRSGRDVPTWNYAVAHLQGKIQLVEEFEQQKDILKAITRFFESGDPSPWAFELPEDLADASTLTGAIISFRFTIESVQAKFKLSQNRREEDRLGVIEGLNSRADDMSKAIQRMMNDPLNR